MVDIHANLTETTENYLKQIYFLIKKHDNARISDIAKNLNRSLSTVTGAVQRMKDDGLINYKPYGKITLTEKGIQAAESIVEHYSILMQFLTTIGVEDKQANMDACEMEHISEESIMRLSQFVNFLKSDQDVSNALNKFLISTN